MTPAQAHHYKSSTEQVAKAAGELSDASGRLLEAAAQWREAVLILEPHKVRRVK